MVKLKVLVPTSYTWRPGQHVFLRIPSLSLLDNHPFTIASAPSPSSENANTIALFVRPHNGFTSKLHSHAVSQPDLSLSAHLDGPYGGCSRRIENVYDSIVLVSGGSGITPSLAWLAYLAPRMAAGSVTTTSVRLIWVVRKRAHLEWVHDELDLVSATMPKNCFVTDIHVTNDDSEPRGSSSKESGEGSPAITTKTSLTATQRSSSEISRGRPVLAELITQALAPGTRTCVFGCGPESMKIDLSNAVAGAQQRVLKGDLKEVRLETETFGW